MREYAARGDGGVAPAILLIEDDARLSECLGRYLSVKGLRVCAVQRSSEVWDLPDLRGFAALLVDAGLPDSSGLDVITELRARGVRAPAMLVTGLAYAFAVEGLEALGVRRVIVKPFSLAELHRVLEVVLHENLRADHGLTRPAVRRAWAGLEGEPEEGAGPDSGEGSDKSDSGLFPPVGEGVAEPR